MSRSDRFASLPLTIAAIVASGLVGAALLALAAALLVTRDMLTTPTVAGLAFASALGFVVVTIKLCRVIEALVGPGQGPDGEGGGPDDGGGGPGPGPTRPRPPSDEPAWWPQFERDLRAYLDARERVPAST
jgi:hypothetical protein